MRLTKTELNIQERYNINMYLIMISTIGLRDILPMIFNVFVKLIFLEWTAAGERNQFVEFDLESTPLQVFTNSEIGSGDLMWVQFFDANESSGKGGGITLYFDSQPKYDLGYCVARVDVPVNKLGTDKNRIWTIKKENTRMKLVCNGVEIFDIETQTSTKSECRTRWSFDCAKMRFASTHAGTDTASDFYRKYISGKTLSLI